MANKNLHIFIGPTAYDLPKNWKFSEHHHTHAPVRRGDIERLNGTETSPARILIVDGVFHSHPAVGHAEIRNAINNGWEVWGVSSMGAIRASEMLAMGMRGYGKIYDMFRSDLIDDDEVTLLHDANHPYTPITEPLVHIKEFLLSLYARKLLDESALDSIFFSLKTRWYGYRTMRDVRDLLVSVGKLNEALVLREIEEIKQYRIKTLDFIDFMNFIETEAELRAVHD